MSEATTTTASQCDLILAALKAANGDWVSMPALHEASGSMNIHTRIDQLRHERGLVIKNQIEREKGSTRQHSSYRLIEPEEQAADSAPCPHVDTLSLSPQPCETERTIQRCPTSAEGSRP